MAGVVALPEVAVSTPRAFADWDKFDITSAGARAKIAPPGQPWISTIGKGTASSRAEQSYRKNAALAAEGPVSIPENQVPRLGNHSRANDSASLGMTSSPDERKSEWSKLTVAAHSDRMLEFGREISAWLNAGLEGKNPRRSGVSAKSGGRAESPLLDLVRTGIENDFERVVFPQYPELREVKRVLERSGAKYASLSGSGSAVYGLFDSHAKARAAARKLERIGTRAVVTSTLTRRQYWKKLRAVSY
jgi:4-diphosphocytidyl-2-C-methyl-D-erythritol kinase